MIKQIAKKTIFLYVLLLLKKAQAERIHLPKQALQKLSIRWGLLAAEKLLAETLNTL